MKKFIYLLAFSFAFVNYSCTTLANLFGGAGVCNCTCAACVNCTGKHHVLTEGSKRLLLRLNNLNRLRKMLKDKLSSTLC